MQTVTQTKDVKHVRFESVAAYRAFVSHIATQEPPDICRPAHAHFTRSLAATKKGKTAYPEHMPVDPWGDFRLGTLELFWGVHPQAVEGLKESVSIAFALPTTQPLYTYQVAGFAPDVGRCLAGDPEHMLNRTYDASELAPVSIIVPTFVCAATPAHEVYNRVAFAIRLANHLATIRPVTLSFCIATALDDFEGASLAEIPIGLAPFDLSTVGVFASPAYHRSVEHHVARWLAPKQFSSIPVAYKSLASNTAVWVQKMLEHFPPETIIFPPGTINTVGEWTTPDAGLNLLRKTNPQARDILS
jgi:hypothetical protein